MVSWGAPGYTNRADENSNIITLVTIITMLLQLYLGIFRTLAHLMSEAYSKSFRISKMMRHIENSGIVKTVYSNIFKHIQGHSPIFSHVQGYSGMLRYIETYSGNPPPPSSPLVGFPLVTQIR